MSITQVHRKQITNAQGKLKIDRSKHIRIMQYSNKHM